MLAITLCFMSDIYDMNIHQLETDFNSFGSYHL